jgi:hypothetical protein
MQNVFIVQGIHFRDPGQPMTAHATEENANQAAAGLVNILLECVELPMNATADTWEEELLRARVSRAMQIGCDLDDLGDDDGDVWITELPVAGDAVSTPESNFVCCMSRMDTPTDGVTDEDKADHIMAELGDERLCGDVAAFYDLIRQARKIVAAA